MCRTGGRGPCDSCGVTYEIKCQTCEQKYVGETARSAFTRGKELLDGMDKAVSQSVLRRHANDCHNGVIPDYVVNVTGVYHGDAMLRQTTEQKLFAKKVHFRFSLGLRDFAVTVS